MNGLSETTVWTPQPGPQSRLLECPIPDIFFGGARGGGKTDGLIGHWITHAGRYGAKARGILFRRSMPELEEVHGRATELFLPLGAEFKNRLWVMRNGATFKLRFLERDEDASKYQGHSYTWAGFDELGSWPNSDPIDKIWATLRSVDGVPCRMLASGNPGGRGHDWIKQRYIDPAPPMTPFFNEVAKTWRVYIPSRLSDNQLLLAKDPGYADRLKNSGPSWLVKAWLEGNWDAAQEGPVFKREWWQFYSELPWLSRTIQSWDTAFKKNADNDYSVCTTWGVTQAGYYLLNVWKERVEFPELKRTVVALAAHYNPDQIVIEDKASGQSLIQELQRETRLPIKAIKVDGDKLARAYAVTPTIEAGKVFLPERASWVSHYIDNLAIFPHGAHDDEVDSTTQALLHLKSANNHIVFGTL